MGVVYLAQATGPHNFKKLVVVKQLKPELAEDEKFRSMFLDEARLAARLNHRNIVQTIEVDQDGDRYFFVMEFLDGRTLHSAGRLKGDKALQTPTILWIICDILAGLHYAHELTDFDGRPLGVVHRDVSPRNVFLTYDGQVKLLDFGVAKVTGRDQETEVGVLKGRVPYMAPEHVSSDKQVDRRADIFSVGVLLREALTGRRVWEGSSEIEILSKLIQRQIPPLPADCDVSEEARAIITKAMAFDRDERYRTAQEMRSDLERYVGRIDKSGSFGKLGEHLAREFSEHREQLKVLIEQHVAIAESVPPPKGEIPALPLSSGKLRASAPSFDDLSSSAGRTSNSESSPRAAVPPHEERPKSATASSSPKPFSLPPLRPKPSVWTFVLFGLVFVVVVVGLTLGLRSMDDPTRAAKPTIDEPSPITTLTGRRPSAAVSATGEGNDLVEMTVRASPPAAQIWIDGVRVGEGPHTAKYARGSRHRIRVSAEGYMTRTETIEVSATASLYIDLEKEAGAAPVASHAHRLRPALSASASASAATSASPPRAPATNLPDGGALDAGGH